MIWRFVCFVSSIIGLLFYALSSSFNHICGKWSLLKIILYTVFSFIICIADLIANIWQTSPSLRFRAHLAFLVFTITTIYSYIFDKKDNAKPDAYSLISLAAFAVMSLCMSKQTHLGFEVDLLYFFCAYFTLLLMKIKLFLVVVGASFSYFLIMFRFYPGESGLPIQDQPSIGNQNGAESDPILHFIPNNTAASSVEEDPIRHFYQTNPSNENKKKTMVRKIIDWIIGRV
ncbi:uncharacterized protein [Medicago truncatula]|nr:uncharacterized protein LOC11409596 [Medicago truncatula]